MSDFTSDDLFDATDRAVAKLLDLYGITDPPVDAVALAQEAFHLAVREADPEDDDDAGQGRFGPRPPKFRRREIVFQPGQSDESRNILCARACARELAGSILAKLGVAPGTENKGAATQLAGVIAPRLLLPSKWFERDARRAGFDLWDVKEKYPTAGYELIALRFLDFDDPCVIAVVDDGTVGTRRANRFPATKKLTPAEQTCLERVGEAGVPQTVRKSDWSARGWPIPNGPFNRIILRAVPDEL
ncbi:MAG: hypothetical protein ACRC7O_14080 [Fimbriiglobus sp.]